MDIGDRAGKVQENIVFTFISDTFTYKLLFKKGAPSEYLNLSVCYDAMYLSNPLISP